MPRLHSSLDLSPHRPAIEPEQIDDLRRRLFGGEPQGPQVPGYEIEQELGRGAFGRVYRAFDPRFGRTVAIKVVPVRSKGTRLRIEREAHALARLSHPNVVQVYDKGPAGDSAYFLALEYIEGPSLEDWIEHERRPLDELLTKFLDVARGLAAAHDADLVHRDFKPANAIVGVDGRVRVLDFGLVRALDGGRMTDPYSSASESAANDAGPRWSCADGSDRTGNDLTVQHVVSGQPSTPSGQQGCGRDDGGLEQRLTAVGRFVGTPYYAAPEQYEGEADARSDQFSFFVALYEALYERRPFKLRRKSDAWAQFINSKIDFRSGPRRVPKWLVRMLRRGLDIDPAERFGSMHEVARLLDHRLHRRPGLVRTALMAGGASLLTASFMGLLSWGPDPVEQCRSQRDSWPSAWIEHSSTVRTQSPQLAASLDDYADRWQQGHANACLIESEPEPAAESEQALVRDEVDACLDAGSERLGELAGWLATAGPMQWDELRRHPGPNPLAGLLATLPDPTGCVTGKEPRGSEAHGEAWRALLGSHVQLSEGDLAAAAIDAERLTEQARRLGDRALLVSAEYQQLKIGARRGEAAALSDVLALIVRALDAGQRSMAADIAATSMSLITTGLLPLTPSDAPGFKPEDVVRLADELSALRHVEAEQSMDPGVTGWLRFAEGQAMHLLGDFTAAQARYREAMDLLNRVEPPPQDHLLAMIELNEAIAMGGHQPPIRSALPLASRALDVRRAGLGSEHPSLAMDTVGVGQLHVRLEDFEGAVRYYRDAEHIFARQRLPMQLSFVRGEIVHAHWLAARRARAQAKQLKRDGEDATAAWDRFEHHRHLALHESKRLEQQLPSSFQASFDGPPPLPADQARLWSVLMHSYLYHPGCWDEALAAGERLERACTELSGDNSACISGRTTMRKILAKGLESKPSSKTCDVDLARLVIPTDQDQKSDARSK